MPPTSGRSAGGGRKPAGNGGREGAESCRKSKKGDIGPGGRETGSARAAEAATPAGGEALPLGAGVAD
jgi:hypothetical protein